MSLHMFAGAKVGFSGGGECGPAQGAALDVTNGGPGAPARKRGGVRRVRLKPAGLECGAPHLEAREVRHVPERRGAARAIHVLIYVEEIALRVQL